MGDFKIVACRKCGQKLRVPADKTIIVSCPKCKFSFKEYAEVSPGSSQKNIYNVGDLISFGQVTDPANSEMSHEIDWRILAISEDKVLVLSENLLMAEPFHFFEEGDVVWEYSSLRTRLNTTFFQSVFSPEEQERIVKTHLDGNVTDKVFLLSLEEFEQYLSPEVTKDEQGIARRRDRMAVPAFWNMNAADDSVGNYWWLRSYAGYDRRFGSFAAHVDDNGYTGKTPAYSVRWVRPAMWITNLAENETDSAERNEAPFLLAIEECFEIESRGTVVTGFVDRGVLRPGDKVEVVGLSKAAKSVVVVGIESHKKLLDQAEKGLAIGVLLRGIRENEIVRGQVLAKPGSVSAHERFKASVYVATKAEGGRYVPFFTGYRPQFFFRTTDVTGVITLSEGEDACMPGSSAVMEIKLLFPLAIEKGLKFTVLEEGQTIGWGEVTEILD